MVATGLPITSTLAVAGKPAAPVCADETPEVVLVLMPPIVPITLTVMVQLPKAAMPPLIKLSAKLPAMMAGVIVPPQVLVSPGVGAICKPIGKVSVKSTFVRATASGLFNVSVIVVGTLATICAAPNALVMPGLPTDNVAVETLNVTVPPL